MYHRLGKKRKALGESGFWVEPPLRGSGAVACDCLRLQWTFVRELPAEASGSGAEIALFGKQALQESFAIMAAQTDLSLKDLSPFTAYEWLLSDEQKVKFAEIGKHLYHNAAKKRHATMQSKAQERRAKQRKVDNDSEIERVRSLFTSS